MFLLSPWSRTPEQFFKARTETQAPGFFLLTGSLVISWIFSKSITNAADLGYKYGWLGGLSYAGYYFSFIVAGWVIFRMRTRGGITSIHTFLQSKYGRSAVAIFSLIIIFRLFNEIWSNTMVIGTYFGDAGSSPYYLSIAVFTGLTLAYTLKGGLRSSFFTDAIQLVMFGILLTLLLWIFFKDDTVSVGQIAKTSSFAWSDGLNLLLVALLQSFSYPFHDPVMTDRGFVSDPKVTRRSFFTAGIVGAVFIFLFSFLGIYGKLSGNESGGVQAISLAVGPIALLLVNFIMIVSAASTLDSTLSSMSKLVAIDMKFGSTVSFGRKAMVVLTLLGTIPIFFNPEILSATTVSGTMVIGLTPIFLFWKVEAPKISFHLSVGIGLVLGIIFALGLLPKSLIFTTGPYNDLLWINIYGVVLCLIAFFLPILILSRKKHG